MVSLLQPIRLMLLDDHALILQGILQLVTEQSDMQVLGAFTRSRELIDALSHEEVDVVVMDFSLSPGELDGLHLVRGLRIRYPNVQLLVISARNTPSTAALTLRCGAKGFFSKEMCLKQLLLAIRRVASGDSYLHPMMEVEILASRASAIQEDYAGSRGLSSLIKTGVLSVREGEVLRCCLDGLSVTQVAEKFNRSVKTISTQKQSAYRKLGVRSDNELFKMYLQVGGW